MPEALELVRFAALASSVHADAVQCLLEDTQRALMQMSADSERLDALESQLVPLLRQQRRLRAMRTAVDRSRSARSSSVASPPVSEVRAPRPASSAQASRPSDSASALRFASSAIGEEDILVSRSPAPRGRDAGPSRVLSLIARSARDGVSLGRSDALEPDEATPRTGHVASTDAEVERVKAEIAQCEAASVKAKLRELEALKQRVRSVDADAVIRRHVAPFAFPPHVEELWSAAPQPRASTQPGAVLNGSNIDVFIARACQRLAGRYEDALEAISNCPLSDESDPMRIFGSLLYAEELTSARNCEAAAVVELQEAGRDGLADFYEAQRMAARVSAAHVEQREETVLGPDEFNLLPEDWRTGQVLGTPDDALLPPARHILTPRFSFADAEELKSLESLRVDFQREVLSAFISAPRALHELRHCLGLAVGESPDAERDANASLVRVLTRGRDGDVVWTTLARSHASLS